MLLVSYFGSRFSWTFIRLYLEGVSEGLDIAFDMVLSKVSMLLTLEA